MDIRKLQRAIVDGLEEVKAHDIVVFNTEALSPLFERVIIASGTSNRQTRALASSVRETVKKRGLPVLRTEGEDNGEWIIVDCGAAVAHIMQPAIRDYYHLEEIWGAKPVRMKSAAPAALPKASEPMPAGAAAPRTAAAPSASRAAAAKRKSDARAPAAGAPRPRAAAKSPAAKGGTARHGAGAPAAKPRTRVGAPPAAKPAAKRTAQRAAQPAARPTGRPTARPSSSRTAKPGRATARTSAAKSAAKPAAKPAGRAKTRARKPR